MSESSNPSPDPQHAPLYQRWLAEMKRRRVPRVIAVYGASSFVTLEVADLVFPAIPLPEVAISLVLWVLILGFPIVVALAWAFDVTPQGLRRTEAATPGEISAIVAAPALTRWPSGLLALGGLALLAVTFYGGRRSAAEMNNEAPTPSVEMPATSEMVPFWDPGEDPRPSIAVLPFADVSQEGDQEYFSDGISMEIQTMLSKIRDLRVAGRSSAFAYRGRDLDMRQIGQELGVDFLLDGSVRKDGDQLRISAELVSVTSAMSVWTDTFNRTLENVFAIQIEIAESIAASLRVPLGLSQQALVSPTLDMEAHDLYLSGRAALRRRGSGVGEAVQLLEAAVARDSTWAPAWAALAEAYAISPLYTGQGREYTDSAVWANSLAVAETAARRALVLDPRNASARVALGGVYRDRWEWEDGEREYLRALEVDPDNEEAHTQYSELLWGMGRMEESLRETGWALAIDRAPIRLNTHGFVLYMNGRFEEAEAMLEEGLAIDTAGGVHYLRTVLANLMLMDGRYREALDRFTPYLDDPAGFRQMGEALAARDVTLLPETAGRGLPQALVMLGELDRALDVLEEMAFAMPFRVQFDIWDPILAPVRGMPRFQDVILPRVHLEGAEAKYLPGATR